MIMVKDVSQGCFISAPIFPRHTFFGMFLIVMCAASTDGDLDREKCSTAFKENHHIVLCISMTKDKWTLKTEICDKNDLIQILGFLLHIPAPNASPDCDKLSTEFHYNSTLDISCLLTTNTKEMKKLVRQVMEGFSGKLPSEVNSSHVMDEFIYNNLFGFPNFTLLDLNYTCFNKEAGIIPYVDICDSVNMTDDAQLYTVFNVTSYREFARSPGCSCVITSTRNQTVSVRAIDVRLVGDTQLHLSAADTMVRVMDSSQLYWWQDGVLLSSPGELVLDLTNINPSELPHSIWLQVSGHDLSIRCGNYTVQSLDLAEDTEDHLSYIAFVGISAGILVFLVVLATVLWRCACRRSQVSKEYAVVCPKNTCREAISCKVPNTPVQNEDESMEKSLASNVYYEVEPNYGEAQSSCNTPSNVHTGADVETWQDQHRTNCSSPQDNIYSHLKDTSSTSPVSDLYDTVLGLEYSTLQRTVPEILTDNVYNT